jgi:hypothetical protein
MKKLTMVAALMLVSIGMYAQNEVGQITLKPMAGVNIATITKAMEQERRVAAIAGVEGEYGLPANFSVSAGLLYSQQGATHYGISMKLDYINIPILLNYYVYKGLAVKAGVQPGFNVSSKIEYSSNKAGEYNTNSFYFSIPFGVSYEYLNFVLDARYSCGISTTFSPGDAKNNWVSITLGYKFALK